jgi:hypothetical protein
VTEILIVEPSASAMRLAEPRKAAVSATISHVGLDGAQLDLADESVDCVLSSYTLCTIPDVETGTTGDSSSTQTRRCAAFSGARAGTDGIRTPLAAPAASDS